MEIVIAEPPMMDEIDAVFHVRGKPVIYTWGLTIFNPMNVEVTPALKAHESVHAQRQVKMFEGPGYVGCADPQEQIKEWWRRYLADPVFRFDEELAAHRAEYRALASWTKDRNQQAQHLHRTAARLASPLYGGVVSYTEARRAIVAQRG